MQGVKCSKCEATVGILETINESVEITRECIKCGVFWTSNEDPNSAKLVEENKNLRFLINRIRFFIGVHYSPATEQLKDFIVENMKKLGIEDE